MIKCFHISHITIREMSSSLKTKKKQRRGRPPLSLFVEARYTNFQYNTLRTAMLSKGLENFPTYNYIRSAGTRTNHFEFGIKNWLLQLFSNCRESFKISKLLEKKSQKDLHSPNGYRPISWLCDLFKLHERLILNRICRIVDSKIIPQFQTWEVIHQSSLRAYIASRRGI